MINIFSTFLKNSNVFEHLDIKFAQETIEAICGKHAFDALSLGATVFGIAACKTGEDLLEKYREQDKYLLGKTMEYYRNRIHINAAKLCSRACISPAIYTKLKDPDGYPEYKADIKSVIAICIALRLNLQEATLLLGAAGFIWKPSTNAEFIILNAINDGKYNDSEHPIEDIDMMIESITGKKYFWKKEKRSRVQW